MAASMIDNSYESYLGNMHFPLSDMTNLQISSITNKVMKGFDPNHHVTGSAYINLDVPEEISGRAVTYSSLEKVGNLLNRSFASAKGCSLFIHSYRAGKTSFRLEMKISAPKAIFLNPRSKIESMRILKKCVKATLLTHSYQLRIELPVRLDFAEKTL
jgi:hypothetical protein